MKSRAFKFKLLCGLEGCIPLDPTDLSEVGSAEEFISIVDKFRTGIRRFNDRNPVITWSPSPSLREDTTLNDIIHDIVNSRKFMNFPNVDPTDYWQVFELNFATETITLYQADLIANPLHELGTMHINIMFSNWDFFQALFPNLGYYLGKKDLTSFELDSLNEKILESLVELECEYSYLLLMKTNELSILSQTIEAAQLAGILP
jgi:hypothetical protein